jgi:hypothetical protein
VFAETVLEVAKRKKITILIAFSIVAVSSNEAPRGFAWIKFTEWRRLQGACGKGWANKKGTSY